MDDFMKLVLAPLFAFGVMACVFLAFCFLSVLVTLASIRIIEGWFF